MRIALIRNLFVHNVIVAEQAFADTLGYDLALPVTPQDRVAGGWSIGGVFYADLPEPVETINERSVRQQLQDAMVGLGSLAGSSGALTGAQLSNGLRLVARNVRRLIRLELKQLDGAD